MSSLSVDAANATIRRGLRVLSRRDVVVKRGLARWGYPCARLSEAGFPTLLRAIVGQQLSRYAAEAICVRLREAGAFEAERCSRMTEVRLCRLGLSRRKASYVRALARSFVEGLLDASMIGALGDAEAIKLLCSYAGIGLWTAEIYLMFAEGRRDIFPAGDLALRGGMALLGLGGGGVLDEGEARGYAELWSPYRSYVSLLLWRGYGIEKRGDRKPDDEGL